jgi:hypothetical protein
VEFEGGASFEIKLNVTMRLNKGQAENIREHLKSLISEDLKKGLKPKKLKNGDTCLMHFDSSDLTENPSRETAGGLLPVINPAISFPHPESLRQRGFDVGEIGIYFMDASIPKTKRESKVVKHNVIIQYGKNGVVKTLDDGSRKVCYEGKVTLNLHFLRADLKEDLEKKFPEKLKEVFAVFDLFLDPKTHISYQTKETVTLDRLLGEIPPPPPPIPPVVVAPVAAVVMAGGDAAAAGAGAPAPA